MRTPFLGGHSVARSKNFADNVLINLFPETAPDGKDVGAFYSAPGLDLLTTVGNGPIRGTHALQNTLYVISGNQVYSVSPGWASTLLGTLTTSTGIVQIVDNGTQVLFADGAAAYYIDASNVMHTVDLPFTGPLSVIYQDSFGVISQANSQLFYNSNSFDFSTWDPLDFSSADGQPDNIQVLIDTHREIWVIKETNVEIWPDAGLAGFPFQRQQGVFLEVGCSAPYSATKVGEGIAWLASNDQGTNIVVMSGGSYSYNIISTPQMSYEISKYPTVADAIGYSYTQEGHVFYVLTFPSGNETWCYDTISSLWHKRLAFSNGQFSRHWAQTHTFFNQKNVVGDYRNGNLYALNMNTLTDAGTQRKWIRTWRAMPKHTSEVMRFSSLEIDMQTGIQVVDLGVVSSPPIQPQPWPMSLQSGTESLSSPWSQLIFSNSGANVSSAVKSAGVVIDPITSIALATFNLTYDSSSISASIAFAGSAGNIVYTGSQTFSSGFPANSENQTTSEIVLNLAFSSGDSTVPGFSDSGTFTFKIPLGWTMPVDDPDGHTNPTYTVPIDQSFGGLAVAAPAVGVWTQQLGGGAPAAWENGAPNTLSNSDGYGSPPAGASSFAFYDVSQQGPNGFTDTSGQVATISFEWAVPSTITSEIDTGSVTASCTIQEISNGNGSSFPFVPNDEPNVAWQTNCYNGTGTLLSSTSSSSGSSRAWSLMTNNLTVPTGTRTIRFSFTSESSGSSGGRMFTGAALPTCILTGTFPAVEANNDEPAQFRIPSPIPTIAGSPLVVLRYSDDGGHTWSSERFASAGKTGETSQRVKFNRLGSTRKQGGLDRIFELSSTDAFGICLIGADLA